MTPKIINRRSLAGNNAEVASLETVEVRPLSTMAFNGQGMAFTESILTSLTYFELLPAAAVTAPTDKLTTLLGANGPAAAQSAKGGVQLTTGAANTNMAAVGAVAATGLTAAITATNGVRFASRFNLPVITAILASAGLNQTPADVDPTAAAGDGATFVFDPTKAISAALPAGAENNWQLHYKVAGVDVFIDSGVKVVAGQDYDLLITFDANLVASYYINSVLVGQSIALTANANLGVVAGAKTLEAVAKVSHVRYVRLSRLVG